MTKDLIMTITGLIGAAVVAVKEYLAVQTGTEDMGSWQFWVGMASAVMIAVFGNWAKKGE